MASADELRALISGGGTSELSGETRSLLADLQLVHTRPKAERQARQRDRARHFERLAKRLRAEQASLAELAAKAYDLAPDYAQRAARLDPAWQPLALAIDCADREARNAGASVDQGDPHRDHLYAKLEGLGFSPEDVADLLLAIDGVDLTSDRRTDPRYLFDYADAPGQWDDNDGRGRLAQAIRKALQRAKASAKSE